MCGRYTLTASEDAVQERFFPMFHVSLYTQRYNIAPTQSVLTVVNRKGEHRPEDMRWGLIPYWAKDQKVGSRMINARAETVGENSAFRNAFARRRCLVIADGFYEWKRDGKQRTPMLFRLKDGEPFAFAGLWEAWKAPGDEWLLSCSIITTGPNELMLPIHDRMPVILHPEAEEEWLDPAVEVTTLRSLLHPYDPHRMETYVVSPVVNSPANDTPECVESAQVR